MLFVIKRFIKLLIIVSQYTPVALLLVIKSFTIDWIARKWSHSRLPRVGEKIGLRHKISDYRKEFGKLTGRIKGHIVSVQLDRPMNSAIQVEYADRHKGLKISLSRSKLRLDKNIVEFKTSDWKFNWAFRTTRAHKDTVTKIKEDHELIHSIISFYSKWIFVLEGLTIGSSEIFCQFRYGFNMFPYIPASKLESLVSELVEIAEQVDSALGKSRK